MLIATEMRNTAERTTERVLIRDLSPVRAITQNMTNEFLRVNDNRWTAVKAPASNGCGAKNEMYGNYCEKCVLSLFVRNCWARVDVGSERDDLKCSSSSIALRSSRMQDFDDRNCAGVGKIWEFGMIAEGNERFPLRFVRSVRLPFGLRLK